MSQGHWTKIRAAAWGSLELGSRRKEEAGADRQGQAFAGEIERRSALLSRSQLKTRPARHKDLFLQPPPLPTTFPPAQVLWAREKPLPKNATLPARHSGVRPSSDSSFIPPNLLEQAS